MIILHKGTKNHDQMLRCSWDITRVRCNCHRSFWAIFSPFTPLTVQKIENFKKMKKKTWRYHHLTQVYQKSWSYATLFLRYMVHDGCNYFWFWTSFCPFTALTAQKIEIWIKKKHLEISSFYTSVPKIMIICYTVSEIWHMTDVILTFHFVLFFAFLLHKSPKNGNF